MKVLLVDDDPDIRRIGHLCLKSIGKFDVAIAASGTEGIEIARKLVPDIILLDMMMPVMDGVTTFKQLRSIDVLASVPVVFFTAKVQRDEIDALVALGAAGVIRKPFDPMTLATEVRAYIGR